MILEGNIDGFLKGSIETIGKNPVINELNVSENGIYMPDPGVDGFAPVNVNVSGPLLDTLNVIENGTYTPPSNIDGFNEVVVNVPIPTFSTDELNAIANGEYTPPSGVDGFSKVIVNVPKTPLNKLTVTENGTYTAPTDTGYDEVNVNVPLPSNAYLLKEIEEVDIASFSDGSNLPMPKLQVGIEPQQDLHGYDSPWVGGAGKNKANPDLLLNGYTNPSNRKYDDTTMAKTQFVKTEGLSTITISATNGNRCYVCYYNDLPNVGDEALTNVTQVATSLSQTITVDSSYTYVAIQVCYNPNGANVSNVQVESGNQATAWQPYSNICPISGHTEANVVVSPTTDAEDGTTYNIQFTDGDNPITVYGGTLDVVSGELKVAPYYVSYNGETLEGEWISDRDVYAVGSTPTIGAQVVNIGATPQVIQLTPTQIKTLLGNNVITADTGSINNIEYFAK